MTEPISDSGLRKNRRIRTMDHKSAGNTYIREEKLKDNLGYP
jgi:hypothetical protein